MCTKEEWKQEKDSGYPYENLIRSDDDRVIATVSFYRFSNDEAKANAHLIVAAVNACQKVNPDNPMAVAESIQEMYEALWQMHSLIEDLIYNRGFANIDRIDLEPKYRKAKGTLAKAERRK